MADGLCVPVISFDLRSEGVTYLLHIPSQRLHPPHPYLYIRTPIKFASIKILNLRFF